MKSKSQIKAAPAGVTSDLMHRPIRTRRLSIAAIVSLLAILVLAGAGARSFGTWDDWGLGSHWWIVSSRGCIVFAHESKGTVFDSRVTFYHQSIVPQPGDRVGDIFPAGWSFAGFSGGHLAEDQKLSFDLAYFGIPLWLPLLLLLIAPVRWLIARPANAPAFPVITDAKRS